MSRHTSSPAEQLLGLLFGAGAALVAGLALLYRMTCAALQDPETNENQEQP
ncbi:TPA: hypothetical protein L4657_006099 [Pseudomonas aeruginosa]|nr:hypothetical protein [Pseudomonas aeruginosa]